VEGGTLVGLGIAAASVSAIAAGVALMRFRQPATQVASVVASSVGVAILSALVGAVVVALALNGYLQATAGACPTGAGEMVAPGCTDPGDLTKQAAATGLLVGTLFGILGGSVTAWWYARSVRFVAGGLLTAAGSSVLCVESLIVLVLWGA
jgi:hypothetical protein